MTSELELKLWKDLESGTLYQQTEPTKSESINWGRVVRIGTACGATCGSFVLLYYTGYTPISAVAVGMSTRGWRALTDLADVSCSWKTAKSLALKYIPLIGLNVGAYFADRYLLEINPLRQSGFFQTTGVNTGALFVQDFATWVRGAYKNDD